MKILHIDETFHPNYGYHTAILAKYEALNPENDVTILTVDAKKLYPVYKEFNDYNYNLDDDKKYEKNNLRIIRVPVRFYLSNRAIYSNKIFKYIKEINPDIIYCHLVESYIAMKIILKNLHYPIIFDSHMLSMASKNPAKKLYNFAYRKIITKRIIKRKHLIIKTQNDDYVTNMLGIPKELTRFISFGTDLTLFNKNNDTRLMIRKKHEIDDSDFVVIYTGKLSEAKGGTFFANAVKRKIQLANNRNIVFMIVGNMPEKIDNIFSESENRIIKIPLQKYVNLNQFYQSADICIFPKQCSLSFYDAQACGLPVVSEDNNVNNDRLTFNNGKTFKSGDEQDFVEKIKYFGNLSKEEINNYSENAIKFVKDNYSYDKIVKLYDDLYKQQIMIYNDRKAGDK